MRILVVSDSHGSDANLRRAILAQPKAEVVIHLGDGEDEAERARQSFPERMFLRVRGNCDWGSSAPNTGLFEADNGAGGTARVFYTHGHLYGVKYGLYQAVCAAREQKAQVLLFGHTHQALMDYDDGLYILNPGALGGFMPSYGTLDVTPQGIVTNVVALP